MRAKKMAVNGIFFRPVFLYVGPIGLVAGVRKRDPE
jgi:hypothetical protein